MRGNVVLHFGEKLGRMHFEEESVAPSPCGEG